MALRLMCKYVAVFRRLLKGGWIIVINNSSSKVELNSLSFDFVISVKPPVLKPFICSYKLQILHVWARGHAGQTWGPGWRRTSCSCPAAWQCGRAGPVTVWAVSGWPVVAAGREAAGTLFDAPCWVSQFCCRARQTESYLEDGHGWRKYEQIY